VRKTWIVAAFAVLLAGFGILAMDATAQRARAADTTTVEETAPATAEEQSAAPAAEGGATATEETTTPPAETAEQPAETAEQPAEPAVEPVVEAETEPAAEPEEGIYADDRILGSADAPVTIIEYASLSCPHCAAFHKEVLPQLKSEYVDKGQVRFIYRDFPTNWPAVQGSLLAHCAADDARFFGLVDTMFKLQEQWLSAADPGVALTQIGALAGMNKDKVAACFEDKAMQQKILARTQEGEATYGVHSTPSFIIDGKLHTGVQTFEMLQGILKDLLPAG
jgi:protein-disulfide isomerase